MDEDVTANDAAPYQPEKVGMRDIYRAVNESESRIKEHITLVLLPISAAVADHETRLRNIETNGSLNAQEAVHELADVRSRVTSLENTVNAGIERRAGAFSALANQRSIVMFAGTIAAMLAALLVILEKIGVTS